MNGTTASASRRQQGNPVAPWPARRAAGLFLLAVAGVIEAGCKPGVALGAPGAPVDAGVDGPAITLEMACRQHATAFCARLEACVPAAVLTLYATAVDCPEVETQRCLLLRGGEGSSVTPDGLSACSDAIAQSACGAFIRDWYGWAPLAACSLPAGARCPDVEACGEGLNCQVSAGASCGVCAPGAGPGASCDGTEGSCAGGLQCFAASECRKPGDLGASCDFAGAPCMIDLVCTDAGCATPPAAGEPCLAGPFQGQPSVLRTCGVGLGCGPQLLCAAIPLAAVGAPCGRVGVANETDCSYGGACVIKDLDANTGVCVATSGVGGSCYDAEQFDGGGGTEYWWFPLCPYPMVCPDESAGCQPIVPCP
jgi:hypothetical protein